MTELGELEARYTDFARRNTRVVVVSLEGPEDAEKTKTDFPHLAAVVSDEDRSIANAVEVVHPHSSPEGSDTAAPTTILIDQKGIVKWLYRPERYLRRLSPTELLAAVDTHLTSGPTSARGGN